MSEKSTGDLEVVAEVLVRLEREQIPRTDAGKGGSPLLYGVLASCQAKARTYRATDFTISGSIVSAVSVGW